VKERERERAGDRGWVKKRESDKKRKRERETDKVCE